MSIGKNSIARAAVVAAPETPTYAAAPVQESRAVDVMPVDTAAIGYLSGAEPTAADAAPSSLLTSVRRRGVLEPLLVARTPDGALWLLDGYRRLAAARTAKLSPVSAAVVAVASPEEAVRLFDELQGTRRASADVREGKFRAAAMLDREMPTYLL